MDIATLRTARLYLRSRGAMRCATPCRPKTVVGPHRGAPILLIDSAVISTGAVQLVVREPLEKNRLRPTPYDWI